MASAEHVGPCRARRWSLGDGTRTLLSLTSLEIEIDALVAQTLERPGPIRLVAIDGPGGAGASCSVW